MEVLVLQNLSSRMLLIPLLIFWTVSPAFAQLSNTREVTTSQLSQGVGATGDTAATAGSTGSLSAKLRLMTTQLNTLISTGVNVTNLPTAANTSALAIRCVNTAGNAFEACGGSSSSTQYADGATQATPTGNVMLWLDTSNVLRAPSATKPLPVNIITSSVGSTSTDDDGDLPSGTTGMTEVINRMYSFNSDSATSRYTRFSHQPLDFDSGAGTENLSVIGIALPASGGPVIGGTSTNPFNVVFPSAQSVSQSGTWTVQPGNTVNSTPWLISDIPATSGGTTPCYVAAGASTNATSCKGSAGQIYSYELVNTTGSVYYLRLYNSSSAPTCSSATGYVRSVPIPASTSGNGIARNINGGEAYSTGLGFCITGGASSTDNTNAATGVYVSINYK